MRDQTLDDMDLERERGITIKARAVAMRYHYRGEEYELNLIDTPGHVDFHYEVSRSLACCEGAVLLVDAFQGVEAQTVANAYAAMEHELTIVPVLNKVDLKHARPEQVMEEMESSLGIDPAEVLPCSGKTGAGVDKLLEAIVERIPPPAGDPDAPLQAMVFDSHYDEYRGAITYVRVMNGTFKKGQKIRFLKTGSTFEVLEVGQFVPQRRACSQLQAGQVGYLICNIKTVSDVHIGDTVTTAGDEPAVALAGLPPAATDGLLRPLSVGRAEFRGAARRARRSSASTIRASNSSRKRAMRWGSASAAAFSACCTWRSSSSGSRENPISISCRPRRT